MRGRTIASFGQAFVCLVDSGSQPAKLATDMGSGSDALALAATLAIADTGAGSEAVSTSRRAMRGMLSLSARSFTVKADMQ